MNTMVPASMSAMITSTADHHFFFNDAATTEIYTLSLHDALPICDYFMQRYHDVISSFGGKTSYDADNRHKRFYLDRKSGSAGMPRPISYAVFCLKKNTSKDEMDASEEAYCAQ